jgi:hypothetical protein
MSYPDFSFNTHEHSFDKDAQGAHENIVEFKNSGEDFVHVTKNYDAYEQKWSNSESKGKIIAYFPEKQLVKLKYENGNITFLELNQQKIDNWKTPISTHFWYRENIFPITQERIVELTALFSSILSLIESKEIHLKASYVANQKWTYSNQETDFVLAYWLSEQQEGFKSLELRLLNNTNRQVPYNVKIGAYISNFYIQTWYLNDYQEQINQILADFVKENPLYSLERIQK